MFSYNKRRAGIPGLVYQAFGDNQAIFFGLLGRWVLWVMFDVPTHLHFWFNKIKAIL
jgi:hypothetical protein